MTQDGTAPKRDPSRSTPVGVGLAATHYALLGLAPSASIVEIRRAYRELSKRFHPDITDLPAAIALEKFQQLNEAYATLSSPERRLIYDQKIRSRLHVMHSSQPFNVTPSPTPTARASSAYFDPHDGRRPVGDHRPLSAGELFALFLLGVTLLACLVLAIAIGLTQGETAFRSSELLPSRGESTLQSVGMSRPDKALSNHFAPNPVEVRTPVPGAALQQG